MKHTSGPWKLIPNDGLILVSTSNRPAAVIYAVNSKDEEYVANANLIAAAPELLEALEECADQIKSCLVDGRDKNSDSGMLLQKALVIIAKAKGEKSPKDDSEDPFDYGGIGY